MHPKHAEFIAHPPYVKFDTLFRVIDALEPKKRDEGMMYTFMQFVKLEVTQDSDPHTPIGDQMTDYTNYNRFKAECRKLPANLGQDFVYLFRFLK
jgi:hypothetical protein